MSRLARAYVGVLMKGRRLLGDWVAADSLRRSQGRRHLATSIHRLLRRHIVPECTEWVQVLEGLARGLWIQINLAHERTWWAGTHEPEVQKMLQQILNEDTVFYDVGAYIGFFSLPAARLGARVVAFEPDPENAARLRANIDRNQLGRRIEVMEAALWSDSVAAITFRRGNPRSQGGIAHGKMEPAIATGPPIEVKTTRLDDFVAGRQAPQVIKIDVEGAASKVLLGAAETLRICRPVLIIEVHTSAECDEVTDFLNYLRYVVNWDIPPERFPRQCFAFPPALT